MDLSSNGAGGTSRALLSPRLPTPFFTVFFTLFFTLFFTPLFTLPPRLQPELLQMMVDVLVSPSRPFLGRQRPEEVV